MARYIWLDGAWVPRGAAAATPALAIHRDFAEPLLCHADGKLHGSRSTYDAAVRAAGCEIVGRSEARLQMASPAPRPALEPVGATLRRALNGG